MDAPSPLLSAGWQRLRALTDRGLPNHIDAISIWRRYRDPSWRYSEYYDLYLPPVPYWGYFFPVHVMAYVWEWANGRDGSCS